MDEVDRLESRRERPFALRAGVVVGAAAVSAVLVAVSWSWHPGRHSSASPAPPGPATNTVDRARSSPRPTASPVPTPAAVGSVFVQPLPRCLRTDNRRSLRIALAVQNLADQPLQLVSVDLIGRVPGLTLTGQSVGVRPCAETPAKNAQLLRPSEELVVALQFALGPSCPPPTQVTARLGFLAGTTVLHAETSNLVDLAQVCR